MAKSSGDKLLDEQILKDTEEEVSKGWALGPIAVEDIPEGAVISKRFALRQGVKTRLIDDFSISGVNESCVTHNKVDLHMIDTFCAVLKKYFMEAGSRRLDPELVAKTYDLIAAYRQVPVRLDQLQFSYVCIYNHVLECAQVYQLLTLAFWCDSQRLQFPSIIQVDLQPCNQGLVSFDHELLRRLHPGDTANLGRVCQERDGTGFHAHWLGFCS